MKSLFSKLFCRTITFGDSIRNFVCVLLSDDKDKKCKNFFDGLITKVDFTNRNMVITEQVTREHSELIVSFDNIVTINRMKDGRLRMWIKAQED